MNKEKIIQTIKTVHTHTHIHKYTTRYVCMQKVNIKQCKAKKQNKILDKSQTTTSKHTTVEKTVTTVLNKPLCFWKLHVTVISFVMGNACGHYGNKNAHI